MSTINNEFMRFKTRMFEQLVIIIAAGPPELRPKLWSELQQLYDDDELLREAFVRAKTNGCAEPGTGACDDCFARMERRIAEIAEIGEQRIAVLRDAVGDFCAQ